VVSQMRSEGVWRTLRNMFVELDTRATDGLTVSLEWDRDTGATQIVAQDARDASVIVFGVPNTDAADAFRHPYVFIR
jgi:hypothetical protein